MLSEQMNIDECNKTKGKGEGEGRRGREKSFQQHLHISQTKEIWNITFDSNIPKPNQFYNNGIASYNTAVLVLYGSC